MDTSNKSSLQPVGPIIDTSNTGLFSGSTLEKLKMVKSAMQKIIIWTIVAGAICGAFTILFSTEETGARVVGKFTGMLFILAFSMLVTIIEFGHIEKGNKSAQVFACFGIAMNVLWTILWIMALWDVFDIYNYDYCTYEYGSRYCMKNGYSILGMLTLATSTLSSLGFFGSLTLSLYEGKQKSVVRPLKYTAIISLVFAEVYWTLKIFTVTGRGSYYTYSVYSKLDMLSAFAAFVFFATAIIAAVVAKRESNKEKYTKEKEKRELLEEAMLKFTNGEMPQAAPAKKTDDELRAEIEERVRREMIEKEVREKIEKEMQEKSAAAETVPENTEEAPKE